MNRFISRKSTVAIAFVLFCAVALLNDGANLTDFVGSARTLHFDLGNGSDLGVGGDSPDAQLGVTASGNHAVGTPQSSQRRNSPSTIVLDEDSPSLPAVFHEQTEISSLLRDDLVVSIPAVQTSGSLYLEHCTLLL